MIRNFRDLGGIRTKTGRVIPEGILFRSANLHQSLPQELDGISAVIDLRTQTEREQLSDAVPDHIAYYAIPILDVATAGITREKALSSIPEMVPLYRIMVVSYQPAIQKVLSVIQNHDFSDGGILWHCTAGKDRCGIITAYVLSSLGVSTEDIMADYMISNESCIPEAEAMLAKLAGKPLSDEERQGIWDAFIAREEYLQAAFDAMCFDENEAFQRRIFG